MLIVSTSTELCTNKAKTSITTLTPYEDWGKMCTEHKQKRGIGRNFSPPKCTISSLCSCLNSWPKTKWLSFHTIVFSRFNAAWICSHSEDQDRVKGMHVWWHYHKSSKVVEGTAEFQSFFRKCFELWCDSWARSINVELNLLWRVLHWLDGKCCCVK
jgi:hypothetical protein